MDTFESEVQSSSMTSGEFAIAIGCTPETCPEAWSYAEYGCTLPDPFSVDTKPKALNRWLEWTVPFLGFVSFWLAGDVPVVTVKGEDYTGRSEGEASIAACLAILKAKQ